MLLVLLVAEDGRADVEIHTDEAAVDDDDDDEEAEDGVVSDSSGNEDDAEAGVASPAGRAANASFTSSEG